MAVSRYYSSTAVETTLSGNLSNSATSMQVASNSGWPVTFPFTVILEKGTANEEIVDVTAYSAPNYTIVRGRDGTTGKAHNSGTPVEHGISARDLRESREHEDDVSAHGVTSPLVGEDDTQTLTNKTMSGADNTFTAIPQSAITGLPAALDAKAPLVATVNAKTADYTLGAGDSGEIITMSVAGANTLTIPTGLPAGFTGMVVQLGAGQTTIAASGTTLRATPGLKLRAQYSAATYIHLGSEVYIITGDLSA